MPLKTDESQWSLTFEVRKSGSSRPSVTPGTSPSQWSLTFEVRKSGGAECGGADRPVVAMEPDL